MQVRTSASTRAAGTPLSHAWCRRSAGAVQVQCACRLRAEEEQRLEGVERVVVRDGAARRVVQLLRVVLGKVQRVPLAQRLEVRRPRVRVRVRGRVWVRVRVRARVRVRVRVRVRFRVRVRVRVRVRGGHGGAALEG